MIRGQFWKCFDIYESFFRMDTWAAKRSIRQARLPDIFESRTRQKRLEAMHVLDQDG